MFSYLTFDCYGTLIDWRKGIDICLGNLLRKNGLPAGVSVYSNYIRLEANEERGYKSYREVLRSTAIKVADALKVSITEEDANTFASSVPSWPPFGDSVKSLKQLGQKGCQRIILSNIDSETLKNTLLQNSLEVDGWITAEDVGSYKPSLEHWHRFFDRYKARKEETLHVAQSLFHDIIPSGKLAISNAWINRYSETNNSGTSPTYVFSDLSGLVKFLG
ncbi:MAG: HAD family hydrolase [Candidatus Bathyarchaeia archaeon]